MKTVVIGAGSMGKRHAGVCREMGLDLVGACDLNPQALAELGQEHGLDATQLFEQTEELLAQTKPDFVIVATTAPSHATLTCLAAERGAKYILCEKPMAVSLAECDRMLAVCAEHGVRLAINHPMRFMEIYTEPRRLVASEEFGGVTSATVISGNAGLAMVGSHFFEMFRLLTGEPPAQVTAWLSPERVANPRGKQFEDRGGAVRVTTAGGKRLYLDMGVDQGHGAQIVYAARLGQVTADMLEGTLHLNRRQPEHREAPTTRYGMPRNTESRQVVPSSASGPARAVIEALLGDGDPPTGEDGRLAVATLIAAHLSDEVDHQPVAIDLDQLPRERTFPWA